LQIGFHLSISKGFDWTLKEAQRLQCNTVQVFVKNPRSWKKRELTDEEVEQFSLLAAEIPVAAHLSYLPNIAKTDEDESHMKGFMHEAMLCSQLGIDRIVVHCGSRKDRIKGIKFAAQAIDRVLDEYSGLSVLLENAAGQGSSLGRDISELGAIFAMVRNTDRMFLCLDTAHLFEAGYDIRKKKTLDEIVSAIDRDFGENKVQLFHINDSKTPLGSNVDRHWHIGKGEIGLGAFKYILNNKRFAHLSGIMETPKMGNMDEENMRTVRSLLSPLMPGSFS
jgi:deoxyribonuclease IV